MKTKIVATALAMFTAFSAVSCKVADRNQNIKSSAGGGYFYITSDYTPTYEMDIEAYPDGDMLSPDYKSQIWIPVVSE